MVVSSVVVVAIVVVVVFRFFKVVESTTFCIQFGEEHRRRPRRVRVADARAKDEANAKAARETNVVVGVLETVVVVVRRLSRTRDQSFVTTQRKKKERAGLDTKIQFSLDIYLQKRARIYIKSANKRRQSSLFRGDEKGEEEERISSFAMEDETRTL